MFAFDKQVKKAFKAVKNEFKGLQTSLNEWIIFLNGNQRELKMRISELERRLEKLEQFDQLRRI